MPTNLKQQRCNDTLLFLVFDCQYIIIAKKANFKSTKANLFRDPKILLRDPQFENP